MIKKDNRNEYVQLLGEAQEKRYPTEKDIKRFVSFAKPIMEEERNRMLAFSKQKLNQIKDIDESREE